MSLTPVDARPPPDEVRPTAAVAVVGAPRSGTSLVAQLVASGGIDFGDHLLPASDANPRGFLEDVRVTDLDDELLAPHVVGRGALPVPEARLAWAGAPAPEAVVGAGPDQCRRMADVLPSAGPFGIKDPRLVWTLDAWRPVLPPDTAFVAVVRHPAEVAASLRAMWEADRPYYGDLTVTVARGLALWEAANRRLLAHLHHGRWIVVDHARLLAGGGLTALAGFLGRPLDPSTVDPLLLRSGRSDPVPEAAEQLYRTLRARARDDEARWSLDGG